jgi:hypothetical protein
MHLYLLQSNGRMALRLAGGIRTIAEATRCATDLLRKLLLQPLAAALVIALVLGAIPMMLTAVVSLARITLGRLLPGSRLHSDTAVRNELELTNQLELL